MIKIFIKFNFIIAFLILSSQNIGKAQTLKEAYFAGGCFWCMEESFDKINGVIESISGYSGGHLKNPTYKDVIYKDTGHVETIEVTYNSKIVSFEELLDVFWKNIDPFDKYGQFCDKATDQWLSLKIWLRKKL